MAAAGVHRDRGKGRSARRAGRAQLGSSRNAVYRTMFGARRKLRAALAANGYLTASAEEADLSDRGTGRS